MQNTFESTRSKIVHVLIPVVFGAIIFAISLYFDVAAYNVESNEEKDFWLQRSGSILTVIGAYITFHDNRKSIQLIKTSAHFFTNTKYKYVSLFYLLVGTGLWGYGDLFFQK